LAAYGLGPDELGCTVRGRMDAPRAVYFRKNDRYFSGNRRAGPSSRMVANGSVVTSTALVPIVKRICGVSAYNLEGDKIFALFGKFGRT